MVSIDNKYDRTDRALMVLVAGLVVVGAGWPLVLVMVVESGWTWGGI